MRSVTTSFVAAVLAVLTTSTGAMAQSYYDDQVCRQYADSAVAPLRDQANSQALGSTLLGAGLGAAIGGAVGCGRRGRRRRRQRPELGSLCAAAIQCLLLAVHGVAETPAAIL
jgi:hypothetical protein